MLSERVAINMIPYPLCDLQWESEKQVCHWKIKEMPKKYSMYITIEIYDIYHFSTDV